MNNFIQTSTNIVKKYNMVEGQNRGLKLDYHVFSGVTNTVIYSLEITKLASQEKVSFPCCIPLDDNPETQILKTLQLLDTFVQLTIET